MKLTDFSDLVRDFIRDQWVNFRRLIIEPQAREELFGGGRIYFYHHGTKTQANVYIDDSLSIPLPNPVMFNSAGEAPPIVKKPDDRLDVEVVNRHGQAIVIFSPADGLFGP